jgi:hypothetical protein
MDQSFQVDNNKQCPGKVYVLVQIEAKDFSTKGLRGRREITYDFTKHRDFCSSYVLELLFLSAVRALGYLVAYFTQFIFLFDGL